MMVVNKHHHHIRNVFFSFPVFLRKHVKPFLGTDVVPVSSHRKSKLPSHIGMEMQTLNNNEDGDEEDGDGDDDDIILGQPGKPEQGINSFIEIDFKFE